MNGYIRQTHRWISILFTLGVIANTIALSMHKETTAVGLLALVPLIVLLLTGLYLFALPYVLRRG